METRRNYALYFLLILFFLSDKPHALAQKRTVFEQLTMVEAAKMTLEADITTIVQQKKSSQYFPGTLTTEDGKVYRIELKPRGRFRRKISEIPPLKMKFKKKQ